jgi:hypothetical protein
MLKQQKQKQKPTQELQFEFLMYDSSNGSDESTPFVRTKDQAMNIFIDDNPCLMNYRDNLSDKLSRDGHIVDEPIFHDYVNTTSKPMLCQRCGNYPERMAMSVVKLIKEMKQ